MSEPSDIKPIIWYFADPMCSWCWGFSPVVARLKEHFGDRVRFALVLGGLRPYVQEAISVELHEEILHHWHEVHRMTGQEFNFENAMADGFVYDTEPASRAVIVAGELAADRAFDYLKAVQRAFYVDHNDVTQEPVLWELLRELLQEAPNGAVNLTEEEFKQRFESEEARQKTQAHFYKSRQFGVRGFPTMILQDEQHYYLLNSGYRPYADLKQEIDALLDDQSNRNSH